MRAERDGEILLEVSEPVRETLIAHMDRDELVAAAEQLDSDEIADIAADLPREVIADVFNLLPIEEREQLRAALSYPEDTVGALMDFGMVTIREDVTLEVVLRYLRRIGELPSHTDTLFVVDRKNALRGILMLNQLLLNEPETQVSALVHRNVVTFPARRRRRSGGRSIRAIQPDLGAGGRRERQTDRPSDRRGGDRSSI